MSEVVNLLSASSTSEYEALLVLAIVIVFGMFVGKLFEKIKIPNITGYIVAGLAVGGVLVITDMDLVVDSLEVISSVALGFIAYGIGRELIFSKLKKSGKEVIVITIMQALFTTVIVTLGLLAFNVDLAIALIFGAIATATEPASIMLLTKKLKTKGPLTDTLIPLVGLDDAVGIVIFGVLLSVGKSLNAGTDIKFFDIVRDPALEITFSIIIGIIFGVVVGLITNKIKMQSDDKYETLLNLSLFGVFATVAIAKIGLNFGDTTIHLSPILTPMVFGVTVANMISKVKAHETDLAVDKFTPPILVAFFTLAGAELVVAFFSQTDIVYGVIIGTAVIYIGLRIVGKISGAWVGAKMMHSVDSVRKYLGLSLLPQAGVALGMAYQARTDFAEDGVTILIVVLMATLFYAFIGPIGVKHALIKSGEVTKLN
ncbi:MAG: cation:proton antiporter [Candidatus Izemoplasma sp.]